LFQNKISENFYRALNNFVSLDYSFDWHRGLRWKTVGDYANPVQTQPSLPTR
jgi:hypothetical protein